jgi:nicotinate-nucleotide adenylyltransferase
MDTLALFGGTFDPVHFGHLNPLRDVAKVLGLTDITLIPCHIPPHKASPKIDALHRINMLKIAIEQVSTLSEPNFSIDLHEINKSSPSYTVETLRDFKQRYPSSSLLFCMGSDSYFNFTQWYQWQEILTLCNILVLARPDSIKEQTQQPNELLPFLTNDLQQFTQSKSGSIIKLNTPLFNISSTQIREKLRQNEDVSELMPQSVLNYIKKHKLYV